MATNPSKHMPHAGFKSGKLTVIQRVADDGHTKSANLKVRVRVECQCGNRLTIPFYYLWRVQPQPKIDCGKCNISLKTQYKLTYHSWYMMHVRCEDPKHMAYKDYGGRGITVCPEWHKPDDNIPESLDNKGFERFLFYMQEHCGGARPNEQMSLDRYPDNDSGYKPGNVRWATSVQQRANQRVRKYV